MHWALILSWSLFSSGSEGHFVISARLFHSCKTFLMHYYCMPQTLSCMHNCTISKRTSGLCLLVTTYNILEDSSPHTFQNWRLWIPVGGICADQTAKIWDLTAGVETRSLDGHPASVVSVRYSLASQLVYTASAYLVTVWDPRHSRCVHSLTSVSTCLSVSVMGLRHYVKDWNSNFQDWDQDQDTRTHNQDQGTGSSKRDSVSRLPITGLPSDCTCRVISKTHRFV